MVGSDVPAQLDSRHGIVGTQRNQKQVRPPPPPTLTTGGLDCTGEIDTMTDGGELGVGITVTTVGGEGVAFGGTAGVTFGGVACVGFGLGVAVGVARTTGFGFGVAVTVTVTVGAGVAINAGPVVVRNATGAGVVEGSWTTVAAGVVGTYGVGDAEPGDAVAAGTTGSALAELLCPPGPGHVNANAVNTATTTAKAASPSVDRRGW